ncbi:hypothetical protein EDWATA_01661 [Edwardsiella tarda ATCC 23685]|uniref:Uncharacterized protein n=1 Tax=Edwardsiella tarda ATCC 23685 TaxID=500638 RepID=D4F4J0_EDWTA|nr:hypothetical protein EDWATA_01661 [Edwardsiella tarda ATCC 23685]
MVSVARRHRYAHALRRAGLVSWRSAADNCHNVDLTSFGFTHFVRRRVLWTL